jgi:RES domain-containing protein
VSELILWRLSAATYTATAFSGKGAEAVGARWSPPGIRVAYCSESRALAVVEVLASVEEADRLTGIEWRLVPARITSDCVEKPDRFPENWRQYPHPQQTQKIGAEWVQSLRSVALRVPSAIVPGEFNYLLNPAHPQFAKVKVGKPEPFSFDPRLR